MAGSSALLLVVVLGMCCCSIVVAGFVAWQAGWLDDLGGGGGSVGASDVDAVLKHLSADPGDALALKTGSGGAWTPSDADWWTAGFMPGCWWKAYALTKDDTWKRLAETATAALKPWQTKTTTHDVGFVIMSSYGQMPSPPSDALVTAAASLDKRYDASKKLYRSWGTIGDTPFRVIIDNLMNLELMFVAAGLPGGKATWKDHAEAHALRSVELFVRDDGSTVHVVEINGDEVTKTTKQGFSGTSCWARGQAWAIYGFQVAHKHTGNAALLAAAKKCADYFVSNLPADKVPNWDFKADKKIKDTSAAAIAACGLFRLGGSYTAHANAILASLLKSYQGHTKNLKSLLCCACESVPQNKGVSVGYVVADYFLMEALQLARG